MIKISKRDKKFYLMIILWGCITTLIEAVRLFFSYPIETYISAIVGYNIILFSILFSLRYPKEEESEEKETKED